MIRIFLRYYKVLAVNVLIIIIALECILRTNLFPYLKTWQEKQGREYISPFKIQEKDYYHVSRFKNWCFEESNSEFSNEFCYNDLGLRDISHTITKSIGTKRVVVLGDSFTEGVGAPVDSTWWSLLAVQMNTDTINDFNYEFINAGFRGSDVLFGYILLRDKLLKYQPDEVIVEMNSTDPYEIAIRGGMERFKADGTIGYRIKGPWWEPVFAHSYIVRLLAYHLISKEFLFKFFTSPAEYDAYLAYGREQICNTIKTLQKFCTIRNIRLTVFFHPFYMELQNHERPFAQIKNCCFLEGINCIDLYDSFEQEYTSHPAYVINSLFYKTDMHNTPAGYCFIARELYIKGFSNTVHKNKE